MNPKIQKYLAYMVPLLILVIFLLVMTSGSYLKVNLESGKEVVSALSELELLVTNQAWEQAGAKVSSLDASWRKIGPLLQISSEEDDIKQFTQGIARLRGYIGGQDAGSALAEIELLKLIWTRLGR